jgi:hypothetical protein
MDITTQDEATTQLRIRNTESQLIAYGDKCSLHIGLHLRDKFIDCLDSDNKISSDAWYKWLSR